MLSFLALYCVHFVLFYAVGLYIATRLYIVKKIAPEFVAIVAGTVGCIVGYIAFWVYLINTDVGTLFSYLFFMASAVSCSFIFGLRRVFRDSLIITPLLLAFFVGLFYTSSQASCVAFQQEEGINRYCHTNGITFDNKLPQLFAQNVYANQEKSLMGDWQGSDRPPLQSGIVLSQAPLLFNKQNEDASYQFISTIAQLMWIPAVWLIVVRLARQGFSRAFVMTTSIFSGFYFFNSIFVWPKLLAGSLTILGVYVFLFQKKKSATGLLLMTLGVSLGFLAHSSAVFTVAPLLFLLRRKEYQIPIKQLAFCGIIFTLLVGPWLLYQKFYDPPGNRLLKWHIGGSEIIDTRGPIETTLDSYRATPLETIIKNKISNVTTPFGTAQSSHLYSENSFGKLRDIEFRFMIFALAILNVGWFLLISKKRIKTRANEENILLFVALIASLFWALVLFGPNITVIHAGSYANMMIILTVMSLLISQRKKLAYFVLSVSLPYFYLIWMIEVFISHKISILYFACSILSVFIVMLILYKLAVSDDRKTVHTSKSVKVT